MKYAPLAGLLCLAALTGCGKYKTPEATFQTLVDSLNKKDWGGFFGCLTQESQDTATAGMAMFANMAVMKDEKKGEDIKAILKKHSAEVNLQEMMKETDSKVAMKKINDKIKDKPAFFSEIMPAIAKNDPSVAKNFEKVSGKIKDVKIDGEKATAIVVSQDKSGKDTEDKISFKKEKDGWKIDMESSGK
jgi:hypothetical protein